MKTSSFAHLLGFLASVIVTATVSAAPGDLYEADFTSGNIYKFDPSGGRTVFASGLSGPEGLAFDSARNLFVSETGTGTIYKYALDGSRTTFATGLNGPASLVFDAAGDLYDADFFGGIIYKFTPAGVRTTFATGLSGPANLLLDTAGNIFQTDFRTGTVFKFTPGGVRTAFATSVGNPHGLAFEANGNLLVANFQGGNIFRFTPTGARTTFATGLSGPHGLVFDESGNLFEADYSSGTIFKFTPGGTRSVFASGLSNPANLIFEPASPAPTANNLLNLSTRAFVGTETGVLIGGIILRGPSTSTVILRAIGPSLIAHGVSDALEDPSLELRDAAGTLLLANDNWQAGSDAATIQAANLAPTDPHEAAIYATLPAGAYTVIVRGVGDATPVGGEQPGITGIGLVELFDLQQSSNHAANISTRGTVLSGDRVMIAGCIIGGTQRKDLIVRALGPSLLDHGVSDALVNPSLQLFDSNGAVVASNDDWMEGSDAAAIQAANLAPTSAQEAAIFVSLAPGAYTAIESPAPQQSGIGLIEIYDLTATD